MKLFIEKILLFLLFLAIGGYFIFTLADGNSDPFYTRFTSPRQSSLVLGTSKAAQGVQPAVLNEVLGRNDIYNYAFTVAHSPYGPVYLRSIKNKLDPGTKDGVFIVTVDPYSIASRAENPEDSSNYRENNLALASVEDVNQDPNIKYLLYEYPYKYIYLITKKLNYVSNEKLHANGWYEVNISMKDKDHRDRVERKLQSYSKKLKDYKKSKLRLRYLEKTIRFLKQHGKVYLVRLPVSAPFLELEDQLDPNFDTKMRNLSKKFDIPYLVIKDSLYDFTDGNHLYKKSGYKVSQKIAEWIKDIQNR
ncbi:hypothetical protein C7S20_17475 [Christiangramia fulva]|uniref:SGNH/GDSL hydrolase family protein n=1 Tax=Christiangramia fulva TaxID=2126553 RepID=A0A2R3Z9E6_9FLAO|nr:hypothetical protein [Christiangramia fulva]AVR46908.1 hypothetical protein C7S20_17475 [Christiangramia fulva]